jgi:VIT1/CCC1 family predicted Fe2+/Mn2+ transporter
MHPGVQPSDTRTALDEAAATLEPLFQLTRMPDDLIKSTKRTLEPNERIAEVLFGLIMVLTFTGSLSVAGADRAEVRTMLIGALGCNLAWGIIDAVLYLMSSLSEKGTGLLTFRAVRTATDPNDAHRLIAGALPSVVASVLQPAELETICQRLQQLPEPSGHTRLHADDWLGALGVFLLVFVSTFPVAIPFIFMHEAGPALRVSNAIAIVLLFILGYAFGRVTTHNKWVMGISMVALGTFLVGMTMALGG